MIAFTASIETGPVGSKLTTSGAPPVPPVKVATVTPVHGDRVPRDRQLVGCTIRNRQRVARIDNRREGQGQGSAGKVLAVDIRRAQRRLNRDPAR